MDPGEEEPGIRLGTMHRIKGLEFRAVVLACGDADDPMHHLREAERRELENTCWLWCPSGKSVDLYR